ncbi:Centrosomal protein POC5 [Galemys pyrenaicus]|uniref:Centrosomal protein POC5 n=1 Tax=Galemys pyrenaicus TaxID=202257 RepID=A0A8J6AU82_GALPY|nr:Centrosomal protein POC5 [Galemys pyrenaicus]
MHRAVLNSSRQFETVSLLLRYPLHSLLFWRLRGEETRKKKSGLVESRDVGWRRPGVSVKMSDDEKGCLPVVQNDSDQGSTVSSNLQVEYEELLRYAIVTPNIESSAPQKSHSKGEALPDVRLPTVIDIHHNQGSSPVLSPRKPSHPVMDFFSSNLLGDSSSLASSSSHGDIHEIIVSDFLISDEYLQKMENVLDIWSSGLKVLQLLNYNCLICSITCHSFSLLLFKLSPTITSHNWINCYLQVISSLSHAIGKQKERIELMRTFFHWRLGHVKSRQDAYESKLADEYFQRTLLKKAWKGWRSVVERKWKDVIERACQARAEEVCVQISNDYENKVAMLAGALENAKAEIQRMQHEKELFEDSMKKAFMRGVCALNLEAMTIFQNRADAGTDFTNAKKEDYGPGVQGKEHPAHLDPSAVPLPSSGARPLTPPAAAMGVTSSAGFPSAASVTSAGVASTSSVHVSFPPGTGSTATAAPEEMYVPRVVTSAQQKAGKTITARITGKCDFASKNRVGSSLAIMGVSPPMSSVVVEKHHPVTVQTIPQATAAKYPRTIHPESGASTSRSLGTRSTHTPSLTSFHSIKVVD